MNKWTSRFLELAELVSSWSKDPARKVGAVIVDKNNVVVSLGYNGFPRGVEDIYISQQDKLSKTVHAEMNAILWARSDLRGCTMYVHPYMPCSTCAGLIIQAGIKSVHCKTGIIKDKWHMQETLDMFQEAGVMVYVETP